MTPSDPFLFWFTIVGLSLLFFTARYFVPAGIAHFIFWKWQRDKLEPHRIQKDWPPPSQIAAEIHRSIGTTLIYSVYGVLIFALYRLGWTQFYLGFDRFGWGYFALSIGIMLVIQDGYFYWTHRWMHRPGIFRRVHRIHHLSKNPSPWSSFSVHPVEALIEGGLFVILPLIMPLHPAAFAIMLMAGGLSNVSGHMGYEFAKPGFADHPVGRWLNMATHHNEHHRLVRGNFGLYFRLWDRIGRTRI